MISSDWRVGQIAQLLAPRSGQRWSSGRRLWNVGWRDFSQMGLSPFPCRGTHGALAGPFHQMTGWNSANLGHGGGERPAHGAREHQTRRPATCAYATNVETPTSAILVLTDSAARPVGAVPAPSAFPSAWGVRELRVEADHRAGGDKRDTPVKHAVELSQ